MSTSYFVIDDSNFARKIVKNVFGKLGYVFFGEADCYKQALHHLKKLIDENRNPDFITLDITMPDMNGDELVPILLELSPNAKIIMTTSVADKETVRRCISSGAKGYILKPLNEEKVLEAMNIITINNLLKKKETKY